MGNFRFHLIGNHQPVELETAANTMSHLGEMLTRQRFIEGRMIQSDSNGVLLSMLIATSRIQCVFEAD